MLTLPWDNPVLPGFYVFEGIDGAGTTTQAKRLTGYLSDRADAHFTFEPTDLPVGRLIRSLLSGPETVEAETLALLYAADRTEHLQRAGSGILARIAAGETIVCDRYLFSSLAYQGTLVDFGYVERLNARFPLPEHLIFIDTPVEEADRRLGTREERDRYENRSLQERVFHTYRTVIDAFERTAVHVHRIDGSRDAETVFEAIRSVFGER